MNTTSLALKALANFSICRGLIQKHLIFKCSICYEIKGRFHCLYGDSNCSLSTFFHYPSQRCLALSMRGIFRYRSQPSMDLPNQSLSGGSPLSSLLPIALKTARRKQRPSPLQILINETLGFLPSYPLNVSTDFHFLRSSQ